MNHRILVRALEAAIANERAVEMEASQSTWEASGMHPDGLGDADRRAAITANFNRAIQRLVAAQAATREAARALANAS